MDWARKEPPGIGTRLTLQRSTDHNINAELYKPCTPQNITPLNPKPINSLSKYRAITYAVKVQNTDPNTLENCSTYPPSPISTDPSNIIQIKNGRSLGLNYMSIKSLYGWIRLDPQHLVHNRETNSLVNEAHRLYWGVYFNYRWNKSYNQNTLSTKDKSIDDSNSSGKQEANYNRLN